MIMNSTYAHNVTSWGKSLYEFKEFKCIYWVMIGILYGSRWSELRLIEGWMIYVLISGFHHIFSAMRGLCLSFFLFLIMVSWLTSEGRPFQEISVNLAATYGKHTSQWAENRISDGSYINCEEECEFRNMAGDCKLDIACQKGKYQLPLDFGDTFFYLK